MNFDTLLQEQNGIVIFILAAVAILFLVFISIFLYFSRWYIQSWLTGAGIGLSQLVAMTLRKVRPGIIVPSKIMAIQAGLNDPDITNQNLEAHYMAGGNVPQVIRALIAANKAKLGLSFTEAAAIDLAGRDVLDAVQTSVYPRVIDCPPRGQAKKTLDAMGKDGIQLMVTARVTVRSNLRRLIGGATEETIMARVGEGIVSAIGSATSHKAVLENPDLISKTVLARNLDEQTAFEIVSIDIADIDVGGNIGARIRADQAEADTRVARARAEGQRAEAVATEQENKAKIEQSRAAVLEAEAEIPAAIAESLNSAKMGAIDWYKLRNIQADTEMRKGIASASKG